MRARRRLALIVGLLLLAIAGTVYALPELVRHAVIARIGGITQRAVRIDRVELDILKGRLAVYGFHLAERSGETPFADFERLDVRLHLLPLLRGRLWIQEAVLRNPTLRVVRFPTGFNLDDLIQASGTAKGILDVTIDRFALVDGTVTLEDRALPESRTWTSEDIQIEARNVSTTRRDDGRAVASAVTAGAPASIEVERLRLFPIHLEATMTVKGLDLALARLYFPPSAPLVLDRGRASSSMRVVLDARTGLRAEGRAQIDDVALVKPGEREPEVRVPAMTTRLVGFVFQDDRLQIGRVEVSGSASVRDRSAGAAGRFKVSTVRASISDLTWPITTPGRLDVQMSTPGGGMLALAGALRPPPAPSQIQFVLAGLDLAPWARVLPGSAGITGVAEANLRIDEALRAGVPTRIRGSIAVNRLGVRDAREEILGARRVEATGLQVHWPARLAVKQLLLHSPRATIERGPAGDFPARRLWSRPAPAVTMVAERGHGSPLPPVAFEIGEIAVRDGAMTWRDQAATPPVLLDFSGIEARVTDVSWPLRGPVGVSVAVRPPGGGQLQAAGRVGIDPLLADLRLGARDADIAPYRAYLPTAARIGGSLDLDLTARLPPGSPWRAVVRGDAALSRVDVRDGQRTVISIGRAAATGLDVEWPQRASVRRLALQQPWILLERDTAGALPLLGLLPGRAAGLGASAKSADPSHPAIAVTLEQIVVDDGGARVVDRRPSPPFAVDLSRLALRAQGLSTAPGKPGRVDLTGQLGAGSLLELQGTVGPIGGPLHLDVSGGLRGFWLPRTNPYLARYVGWHVPEGWLTTSLHCRIDRDALDAKTDIRLSRLQLVRGAHDEAETRVGLPLGLIAALMKDSRGDIHLSLPVGGHLRDPRFDFSEAIWSVVRNVAIKAITAPVSWIGRVQLGPDARIEQIQVDPIRFEPGTAKLTPAGHEQASRVVAFLQQRPELRMALTPVISPRDRADLGRQTQGPTNDRAPPEASVSPDATEKLAAQRVEAVRALVKQAGIDPARLPLRSPLVPDQEGAEQESQVALDLAGSQNRPQPPPQRRELLGVPVTGTRFP